MDGCQSSLVFLAILAVVAPIVADDLPLATSGGSGPGFPIFPNPQKCKLEKGKWVCPGGGGNPSLPPEACRCCTPFPSSSPRCQIQCAAVRCPEVNPVTCRCCSLDKAARPEGCGAVCAAVSCLAPPITPPNPTVEDCGCCEGVRRDIPGCRSVCTPDVCPGAPAPSPPGGCGCCTKSQKGSAECSHLCAIRCKRLPIPSPPKCDCCGAQKFLEGTNKVSLKVSAPGCDCTTVLCPQVKIETSDG